MEKTESGKVGSPRKGVLVKEFTSRSYTIELRDMGFIHDISIENQSFFIDAIPRKSGLVDVNVFPTDTINDLKIFTDKGIKVKNKTFTRDNGSKFVVSCITQK